MTEFLHALIGIVCILLGGLGGAGALMFSQDVSNDGIMPAFIVVIGAAWAGALIYLAARLFGF